MKKFLLIILIYSLIFPSWIFAKNCGGGVDTCACGDTVIASYTLTESLNCTDAGPALTNGNHNVTINLGGYTISGDGSDVTYGITSTDWDGLTITNGTITNMYGHIINILGGVGITISNLTLTGALDGGVVGGQDAIYIGKGTAADEPSTVSITGNTIGQNGVADDISRQGIAVVNGTTMSITNNNIYGGRIGVDIEPNAGNTVNGVTITGNTINTLANTDAFGGGEYHHGIDLNADNATGSITGTVIVSDNTINLNDEAFSGVCWGFNLNELDDGSTVTISNNTVTGTKRGFQIYSPSSDSITITGNSVTAGATLHNLGLNFSGATAISNINFQFNDLIGFDIPIDTNVTGTIAANVLNNTIDCDGALYFGFRITNYAHNITIKNNIFFGTPAAGAVYIQVAGSNPTVSIDNNCYEDSGNYWNWQGTSPDINFASWQSGGSDANGVNSDPLFEDASGSDFRLKPTSPAIKSGDSTIFSSAILDPCRDDGGYYTLSDGSINPRYGAASMGRCWPKQMGHVGW